MIAASGKTDASAEMDELKRRVAALRAAENLAKENVHRSLTKENRKLYVAFITDEQAEIEWPKKVARLYTVLTALEMLADGSVTQEKRYLTILQIFIFWSAKPKEAVATLTWSHLEPEMKAVLPLEIGDPRRRSRILCEVVRADVEQSRLGDGEAGWEHNDVRAAFEVLRVLSLSASSRHN